MEGQTDSKPVQSSITEQEEQKISDQLSDLNIQEEDSGSRRPYILMHTTEEWASIVELLTPIAEKKLSLDEIVVYISILMKQYEPNKEVRIDLLQEFFKILGKREQQEWEIAIFPYIAKMVLKSPELFPSDSQIFLLGENDRRKQILTKEQCACLLAQMFMCTILDQKNKKLPRTFNFSEVFTAEKSRQEVKLEKIKCVGEYFRMIKRDSEKRSIEFERIVHQDSIHGGLKLKDWKESPVSLGNIKVKTAGKIEDAVGAIEVDFANKFLGGGVLRTGAAQEEIQFITSPEHLVGLLFCEVLGDHEAIKIRGCKTFCDSKGYLDKFKFGGGILDKRPITEEGILDREVLAIDALNFRLPKTIPQFSEEAVLREVNP